jgi:hypothetical protein
VHFRVFEKKKEVTQSRDRFVADRARAPTPTGAAAQKAGRAAGWPRAVCRLANGNRPRWSGGEAYYSERIEEDELGGN